MLCNYTSHQTKPDVEELLIHLIMIYISKSICESSSSPWTLNSSASRRRQHRTFERPERDQLIISKHETLYWPCLVDLIISQCFGYFLHLIGCYVAIFVFIKQGEGNLRPLHLTHSLWFTYSALRLPERKYHPNHIKIVRLIYLFCLFLLRGRLI